MTPDSELLARFARTKAEDAFAELVKRHVNLVYSAALRQANGDAHLAQDVAQTVFADLARIVRGENRRRDREEKFMREPENSGTGVPPGQSANETEWEKLRPALDAAMHELKEADRETILLRYFENRSFAEVGRKLGLNENAARMRVERALEKLRTAFAQRGVATTATLASVISANAVQLAPAGLAATLTTASIVSAGTGTFTLMKIMTMTKLKLGISALVVAGAAAALVVQHQDQEKLRVENDALTQQVAQLKTDTEKLSNQPTTTGDSNKLPDEQFNELLRLRGEVGLLQKQLSAQRPAAPQRSAANPAADSSADDFARQLAVAIAQGDPAALETLNGFSKKQHDFFNSTSTGLTGNELDAVWTKAFGGLLSAFNLLSEEAAGGNTNALRAIAQAAQMSFLQGNAVASLGDLAGHGNEGALKVLLNPEQYGLLLSGVVGALKPAADSGNQRAVAALASILGDETKKPLWLMASEGLKQAAASGNAVAIDALKSMPPNQ